MKALLLTILAVAGLACNTCAQPKSESTDPLQYTIRNENGSRTSRNRDAVLKTLKMPDEQVREWVEAKDEKSVKENRSATFFRSGFVEVISRDSSGQLQYTVRDRVGSRTGRNRDEVLKTVKMTPDEIKPWATGDGRSTVLDGKPRRLFTVSSDRASMTSQDGDRASAALKLTDENLLEWVRDEKAAKEGRAVTFVMSGHLQVIWRGPAGQILYGVVTSRASRTSRVRESVLKTVEMTEEQIRAWVEDGKATSEGRCATFAKAGYVEIISRGNPEEPPR